jgi:hypothetical protein
MFSLRGLSCPHCKKKGLYPIMDRKKLVGREPAIRATCRFCHNNFSLNDIKRFNKIDDKE